MNKQDFLSGKHFAYDELPFHVFFYKDSTIFHIEEGEKPYAYGKTLRIEDYGFEAVTWFFGVAVCPFILFNRCELV